MLLEHYFHLSCRAVNLIRLSMLEALNLMCEFVARVQVYMLEIYQDSLIDLLLPKNAGKPRKLEIKKDSKVIITHFF